MRKVILLSGREMLPPGLIEFAISLYKKEPFHLTGVFLPEASMQNTLWYYTPDPLAPAYRYIPERNVTANSTIAIAEFEKLCQTNGVSYDVHELDVDHTADNVRKESRFADLLLMSHDSFDEDREEALSNEYTTETLHFSECPIVLVPQVFSEPENIILTYDGSASSVFAIKQFALTLPSLCELKTQLVYMKEDWRIPMPDKDLIKDIANCHFRNLTVSKVTLDAKKHLLPWVSIHHKTVLVTGAYGRSYFSRIFKESFVDNLIKTDKLTIFIAHK